MNREIKFRGKMVDSDDWWMYGYLREVWGEKQRNFVIAPAKKFQSDGCTDKEEDYVQVETIGQFTGRTDKNGKEIYEGDIVRVPSLDPFGLTEDDVLTNAIVTFYMGSFIVEYNGGKHITELLCLKDDEIEVIGNIHDNPELLEDKK